MYGIVTLLKLVLVVATCAWLLLRRLRPRLFAAGVLGWLGPAVLVALSLVAYLNVGRFHAGAYFHNAEFFHYYLSAKYFDELGYDGLYGAALLADAESAVPAFAHVEQLRDLRTAELVPVARVLRAPTSYRGRFGDDRWRDFRSDLAFFVPHSNEDTWKQTLQDHGYNAPPSRTAFLAPFVRLLGPANTASIQALALLDLALIGSALLVAGRHYGVEVATVGAVAIGADLSGYDWIGGSPLRYAWLALAGAGVFALERGRHAAAGLAFGGAAMLRLFPAFFALAVLLAAALRVLRTRRLERAALDFAGGLLAAIALLFGASLVLGGGIEAWQTWFEKFALHAQPDYLNNVGLRSLLGLGVPFALVGLLLSALTVACLPRVSTAQAAILGAVFIYVFGSLPSYYYGFLVLFLLWQPAPEQGTDVLRERLLFAVLGVHAVALSVRLLSPAGLPLYDPWIYVAMSGAVLLLCGLTVGHVLLRPPEVVGSSIDS